MDNEENGRPKEIIRNGLRILIEIIGPDIAFDTGDKETLGQAIDEELQQILNEEVLRYFSDITDREVVEKIIAARSTETTVAIGKVLKKREEVSITALLDGLTTTRKGIEIANYIKFPRKKNGVFIEALIEHQKRCSIAELFNAWDKAAFTDQRVALSLKMLERKDNLKTEQIFYLLNKHRKNSDVFQECVELLHGRMKRGEKEVSAYMLTRFIFILQKAAGRSPEAQQALIKLLHITEVEGVSKDRIRVLLRRAGDRESREMLSRLL